MEVTFEEARAHLGVETQWQWNDLAMGRTTPTLFGLYSVVTLTAQALMERETEVVRRGTRRRNRLSLMLLPWFADGCGVIAIFQCRRKTQT